MESKFICVLCNNNNLNFHMNPRDSDDKKIYICNNCNLIQLHPRITIERVIKENGELEYQDRTRISSQRDLQDNNNNEFIFNKNADKNLIKENNKITHVIEGDKYRYLKHFKNTINKYNLEDKNLRVLDIGCGYGYWCHTINENFNYKVTGIDLNINKILYGKNTLNFNFNYIIEKIENEDFIKNNENKFDIITCWHVIEHVYNPILFISNALRLLNNNGVFIFEIPNEDDELINLIPEYSKLIHFQDHVNYFNIDTLKLLLNNSGIKDDNFVIEGCQRYGFYNYIDWIRYKKHEKVLSDDYVNININPQPRTKIEELWFDYREKSLNCDTLFGVIQK